MIYPPCKLTANAPEDKPSLEERIVFQPSLFGGELLVSGRVVHLDLGYSPKNPISPLKSSCFEDFVYPDPKKEVHSPETIEGVSADSLGR